MNIKPDQAVHPEPKSIFLPATGTWPQAHYLLDGRSQDAIDLAVACGRPLLVRGLPGTGKSDLARAAAMHLERAFVYEVINARTEPQDLLWRFDAIARLADAQARGAGSPPAKDEPDAADPRHYVSPGVMWWAINWGDAEEHLEKHGKHCKTFAQRPDKELDKQDGGKLVQKDSAKKNGCVLLLDEIDKADSELPNSLLEVLANTGFRLPWDGDHEIKSEGVKPLIIITTNEDRELPAAFLRRCLVLMLEAEGEFKAWIKERARVHFRDPDQPAADEEDTRPAISNAVLDRAAELLQDNPQASAADNHKPGLAEYLDLLRGLHKLAENDEAIQLGWLARVSGFAYNKNAAPKH